VTGSEADAAARLLERLLADPTLRARFRRDPVAASREAGLESVAHEMALGGGKAMDTLDVRESRSSLAGVLMAAALEGVGVYDFSKDLVPHLEGIPDSVGQVLSRVNLPALPGVATAQAAQPSGQDAGEFKAISPQQAGEIGAEGTGGSPSPETLALLENRHVALDANGIADLKAGKMDPRVVSVLSTISQDHSVSVSATISDHDKLTSGGSVSNHFYGRAFDIATVDGQPVGPGNEAARELAESLSQLDPSIRPSEIGSPWALSGAAYFSDAAHQNHIHVGFDDPIGGGWQPPEEAAAPVPAADTPQDFGDGSDGGDSSDDSSDGGDEPGGLEDPGGDTDEEADAESDGGDGEEDDSVSDDPSDEQEDDEGSSDESDEGVDGDHDDSSDSSDGSDDTVDSGSGSDDGSDSGAGGDPGIDLGEVDGSYPGDDAPKQELAAWMGSAAEKRGLPAELPVMASLVESGLQNVDHGDADSVGFFQMRVGIWNKGDYAGYPEQAELQLKWFLDQAAAVKAQRIASGKPVDDPGSYGDWIADVERPAEQYRGRYQLRLEEARGLLKAGAGSGSPGSGDGALEQVDALAPSGDSQAGPRALTAVAQAKKELGTPYVWGGSSPQTGFDCSGLVQWAYAKAGITIPRTSEQQILASNGKPVDRSHLLAGDLVFFRNSSGDVHHVGISLGGDKFINAPHTGDVVKVASLKESYYAQEFAGGRRFDVAAPREADWDPANVRAVDPDAVRNAELALARDAAEVQRPGTLLFEAVKAQEVSKGSPEPVS
jgi:cell wall-associated NlpC family hydrolase